MYDVIGNLRSVLLLFIVKLPFYREPILEIILEKKSMLIELVEFVFFAKVWARLVFIVETL